MKRYLGVLVLGLALPACGDDGKPKLYGACSAEVVCSGDLVCHQGECTRSCSVKDGLPSVGDCLEASVCDGEITGCCKVVVISDDGAGKGNCTANPSGAGATGD